jgi:hypothetical protein
MVDNRASIFGFRASIRASSPLNNICLDLEQNGLRRLGTKFLYETLPSEKGRHHIDNDIRIALPWFSCARHGAGLNEKNIFREGEIEIDGPL